jgi:hypothetical protein
MIYHPRPYDSRYGVKLPANGVEINYTVSAGKCSAFYIPSREVFPKRLWIAFCGNGSLVLDWLANILVNYPVNGDAFLLVDYPGYGKNAGYAMIDSTRASADAAVRALEERLHMPEERLTVCTIGHSLARRGRARFCRASSGRTGSGHCAFYDVARRSGEGSRVAVGAITPRKLR